MADSLQDAVRARSRTSRWDYEFVRLGSGSFMPLGFLALALCAGLPPWRHGFTAGLVAAGLALFEFLLRGRFWVRFDRHEFQAGRGWLLPAKIDVPIHAVTSIEPFRPRGWLWAGSMRRIRKPDPAHGGKTMGVAIGLEDGRYYYLGVHDPERLVALLRHARERRTFWPCVTPEDGDRQRPAGCGP